MAVPSTGRRCGFCGRGIKRSKKGGRPKDYCNSVCRRRAQRRRDRARHAAGPAHGLREAIADDLYVRARQLCVADSGELSLAQTLELTGRLREDAECLAAVAVDTARQTGLAWAEVAAVAGVTEGSAKARWGGERIPRLVAARTPLPSAPARPACHNWRSPAACTDSGRHAAVQSSSAARELGAALHALHIRSSVSLRRVSALSTLPVPDIASLLGGCSVASWPETYMLSHVLGGEPQEMRLLWQQAWGDPETEESGAGAGHGGTTERCGARLPGLGTAEVSADVSADAPWDRPELRDLLAELGAAPSSFPCLQAAIQAAQRTTGGREGRV